MQKKKHILFSRLEAVMLGHAVGDALGVPVEFCTREELTHHPVTDMQGFGTYAVPRGCWSDDTSMALACLDSLKEGRFDAKDMMERFSRWYFEDWYTPTGETFDMGNICSMAIENFARGNTPPEKCGIVGELSNGNGSLMRIHPAVLWAWCCLDEGEWREKIDQISALTHAHERAKLGCRIYAEVLLALLDTPSKEAVFSALAKAKEAFADSPEINHYQRIFAPDFAELSKDMIESSGYVVHTLEAALWCLLNTKSYEECVLCAVNLGDDTDTTAAVAGGLAGALYGLAGLPWRWISALKKQEDILSLCQTASQNWAK